MSELTAVQWWKPHEVAEGHRLRATIGPLALELRRGCGEWRLGWSEAEELDEPAEAALALEPVDAGEPLDGLERHVFARAPARVRLAPQLLDRPVVVRPRQPVFLPSGEETTLYLSSPVCVRVEVGEDPGVLLREIATLRLSDTWFGPSTRVGELCYSGRTRARYALEEVPRRPHRVLTPLHVVNRGTTTLSLEKLSLPVPALSLYGGSDGRLWTQAVSLVRTADSDLASLREGKGPPPYAGPAERLAGPRAPAPRGGLVRAFSVLFGD